MKALVNGTQTRTDRVLAGPWRFQLDPDDRGETEGWFAVDFDRSAWSVVPVPRAWDLYDQALWGYETVGWFAAEIPAEWTTPQQWQRLHFSSVGTQARVWLNGRFLGEHFGRYLPFEVAVTPHLQHGEPNVLVLRVDNRYRPEWLPGGDVVEWMQYGGILRPVYLVGTAPAFIAGVGVTARPTSRGGHVVCDIAVANCSERHLSGQVGVVIPTGEALVSSQAPVACAPGTTATVPVVLELEGAHAWSPDSPVLYQLRVELTTDTGLHDVCSERFGIRSVEVRDGEILLNGKPLRVKGVNRYDEYGGFGPTPPADLIRADLERIKQTGANLIRVHYPQDPVHLEIMDEIGLLLIEEVPLNWWPTLGGAGGPADLADLAERRTDVIDLAEQTLEGMVQRDRNHPCVIAWSMGNECATHTPAGIAAMRRLLRRARTLDPSRLLTFVAHGPIEENLAFDEADFVGANLYPGVFQGEIAHHLADMDTCVTAPLRERLRALRERFPGKPIVVTEYGARGIRGLRGDNRLTEDHQAAYIRAAWKAIAQAPGVAGGVLWSWADYYHRLDFVGPGGSALRSPHGPYGVVTVDRRPKRSFGELARLYGGSADEE